MGTREDEALAEFGVGVLWRAMKLKQKSLLIGGKGRTRIIIKRYKRVKNYSA